MSHRTPTERSFGLSVGTACLVFAGFGWWREREVAPAVLAVVGVTLVGAGFFAPAALRVPNRLWLRFAAVLGWINARVLLTLFFFVVLTPVGLVMRAIGRNPLRGRSAGTNWSTCVARRREPSHYQYLF